MLLHRLPMTARLSLAVAGAILVTALGTTQIAMQSLSRQVEGQLDRMGQIYLDGLAAALLPSVIRQDAAGIDRALDEALRMHQGLLDRRLFLLDAQGRVLARADRAGLGEAVLPTTAQQHPLGHELDAKDGSYWVWRPLADQRIADAQPPTVVANLDVADYVAERRRLWWRVGAFNLGLGVVCALLAVALLRRLQRPLDLLTQHLHRTGAAGPGPVPLPEGHIPTHDRETARLLQAYNRMVGAAREREALLTRMAEQEREAVLGRLAATLAHEVRNPLAGVLTAIETLRKFGDRPQARAEALDFMERGMRALAAVADATLATHRPAEAHAFGPQDLQDVQRLVEPQAQRAGVALVVESGLAQAVPVAGGEVRQVLLNLLLNALDASTSGGRVTLRCTLHPPHLRLEVIDEGAGLPAEMARSLERGTEPAGGGLGVAVIVRLVQRLHGRVAVDAHSGRGTHITLEFPLDLPADTLEQP